MERNNPMGLWGGGLLIAGALTQSARLMIPVGAGVHGGWQVAFLVEAVLLLVTAVCGFVSMRIAARAPDLALSDFGRAARAFAVMALLGGAGLALTGLALRA